MHTLKAKANNKSHADIYTNKTVHRNSFDIKPSDPWAVFRTIFQSALRVEIVVEIGASATKRFCKVKHFHVWGAYRYFE